LNKTPAFINPKNVTPSINKQIDFSLFFQVNFVANIKTTITKQSCTTNPMREELLVPYNTIKHNLISSLY